MKTTVNANEEIEINLSEIVDHEDNLSDEEVSDVSVDENARGRKHNTKITGNLVAKGLSSNKAAVVCQSIFNDGIDITTPSQSGIWRKHIRNAEMIKKLRHP